MTLDPQAFSDSLGVLALDPGTTHSGYCHLSDKGIPLETGTEENGRLLEAMRHNWPRDELVIEMVASYGMPVGREVFETCVWIGRFMQAWPKPAEVKLIYRRDVKLHLCGDSRAKDANIRTALIDRFGAPGTKKAPGVLYGTTGDAWQAVALAVTAWDKARAA